MGKLFVQELWIQFKNGKRDETFSLKYFHLRELIITILKFINIVGTQEMKVQKASRVFSTLV